MFSYILTPKHEADTEAAEKNAAISTSFTEGQQKKDAKIE